MSSKNADFWEFQSRLVRVVDGDTIDLLVDTGFRTRYLARVRLRGVDTAEVYGVSHDSNEYERGLEHSAYVRTWFANHINGNPWPLYLKTEKDAGKYGRWIGVIVDIDTGDVLNNDIIVEYPKVESK